MNTHIRPSEYDNKYYIFFETTDEGIRQYCEHPESERKGTSISKMRVEGRMVPAIKLKVNKAVYDIFKRAQWMEEFRYNQRNRCVIPGANHKSRLCPCRLPNPDYENGISDQKTIPNACYNCAFDKSFKSLLKEKNLILFSTLDVMSMEGQIVEFEPIDPHPFDQAEEYTRLLNGFINYIKTNYPKYRRYTELVELLGQEYTLHEASRILGISYRTLYGWIQTLRPIYDKYTETIDRP